MRSLSFSGGNRDGQYPWSGDRISIAARLFAVLQMEQLLGRGGGNATLTRTGVARHLRVGKVMVTVGSEIPNVGITPLVSMSKEPVEVDLNTTPLSQCISRQIRIKRAITEQEFEALIPRHAHPTKAVSLRDESVNCVSKSESDIGV